MAADTFARPIGFDHSTGKRRAIDQLRLAEYSAKAVGAMARVSREDADVAELDVWHKAGTAGFIVRSTAGDRFFVEVREIDVDRSEEHTSEPQSLMRNSYAVFCLKKNTKSSHTKTTN